MATNRKLRIDSGIKVKEGSASFSSGTCTEESLAERVNLSFPEPDQHKAGAFVIMTDKVQGMTYGELKSLLSIPDRLAHLLELRVFAEDRELHVLRDVMGADFTWRLVVDGDASSEQVDYLDEEQFLDIDSKWPSVGQPAGEGSYKYKTASGGEYQLPLAGAERIQVRNYLAYDEDGLAYVEDFRVVKLLPGEGE